MLEPLAMQSAHCLILFPEESNTPFERVGNAKVIAIEFILAIGPFITQGSLHLLDSCDEALGFLRHMFFFSVEGICQQ